MVAAMGYFVDSFAQLLLVDYVPRRPLVAIPIAVAEIAFPLGYSSKM